MWLTLNAVNNKRLFKIQSNFMKNRLTHSVRIIHATFLRKGMKFPAAFAPVFALHKEMITLLDHEINLDKTTDMPT